MCLILSQTFRTREQARKASKLPLVAKKDIIVYKRLKNSGFPPFRSSFKYEKGFHYYQTGKPFSYSIYKSFTLLRWELRVFKGLHSYSSLKIAQLNCNYDEKIVKMIIPKGAFYFINEGTSEIVSSELIYP